MIKAVLFDLDGVLIDTEILSFQAYQRLLERWQQTMSLEQYLEFYSGKTERANIETLLRQYPIEMSADELFELSLAQEAENLDQGVELKKGVHEAFAWLKENNIQTALVTSSIYGRAMELLKDHGLDTAFDCAVTSEDVTHSKPDPQIYRKALEKMNLRPEEAVVIEDSENGILSGVGAGIRVVCIPDMKAPSPTILAKAAGVLNSLEELPDWIAQHS